MQPAYSVIFFTTASGLGYGLLALTGLLNAAGVLPPERWFGFALFLTSLGAITFGLLSSTAHLGHPERSWRAVSQWRSSWLAREGVMAIVTYIPAAAFAIGWVFYERNGGIWALLGVISAIGAAVTVFCTAKIYATLKPIHQWTTPLVLPNYLALSLMSGALWLAALTHLFGVSHPVIAWLTLFAVLLAWGLKRAYWRHIDMTKAPSTPESATGLGALGKVRLLESPHTQENYLMREMGYTVARKHAAKLRTIAAISSFGLPLALSALALALPGGLATVCTALAALIVLPGLVIERWLFFAEAKHAVTLYYGADAA
jgi:DMSO reductase anchor subunit